MANSKYASQTWFDRKQVGAVLHKAVGRNVSIRLRDGRYRAVSRADWATILHELRALPHHKYVADIYDCDDYAGDFKSAIRQRRINGCGFADDYDAKHAYNCLLVVGADGLEVGWCEPQSDKFVQLGDKLATDGAARYYTMQRGELTF